MVSLCGDVQTTVKPPTGSLISVRMKNRNEVDMAAPHPNPNPFSHLLYTLHIAASTVASVSVVSCVRFLC